MELPSFEEKKEKQPPLLRRNTEPWFHTNEMVDHVGIVESCVIELSFMFECLFG